MRNIYISANAFVNIHIALPVCTYTHEITVHSIRTSGCRSPGADKHREIKIM
jgi:hypothetical protein